MPVDKKPEVTNMNPFWEKISAALRAEVSPEVFDRWFKAVEPVEITAQHLTLKVPNDIYRYWIEDNYIGSLRAAILLAVKGPLEIRFVCDGAAAMPEPEVRREPARAVVTEREAEEKVVASGMNPRNTFETFVVGANNQFAHAACVAVGKTPGKVYNPLFFYGGVGLGKTHLMHAIGQHIMATRKGAKVSYVTSERFTNEFIDALQNGTIVKFRKRYRQVDVLLIDDIQFFAGKERSQEEFFHTFNTLFDGHKQIVLSSDRPPSEIGTLEPRLVSRFEWGMTADLQPPDVETRTAILQKKAAALGVRIEPELIDFLAQRIRTNIRRLEGALMRVASFISLTGGNPSQDRVEILLKDLLQEEARRSVSIDNIQKRVAEHFDVRFADMTSKRRPKNIAFPRQIAMYIARELTKSSLMEIGDAFGGRDHGTVLHAHRLVKERIATDEKIRQVVKFLQDQLQR